MEKFNRIEVDEKFLLITSALAHFLEREGVTKEMIQDDTEALINFLVKKIGKFDLLRMYLIIRCQYIAMSEMCNESWDKSQKNKEMKDEA